ncbi:GPI inositol deacylase [Quaeritorhiza haematococci]|nr:GPI inositol deacylase [Quaeritorhiza haematococci]
MASGGDTPAAPGEERPPQKKRQLFPRVIDDEDTTSSDDNADDLQQRTDNPDNKKDAKKNKGSPQSSKSKDKQPSDETVRPKSKFRLDSGLRWPIFPRRLVYFSLIILGLSLYSFYLYAPDPDLCRMTYMYPDYVHLSDFDATATRLGNKYQLYLYKERRDWGFESDFSSQPRGIPVIFIPGSAGSRGQVRSVASVSAKIYAERKLKGDKDHFEPFDFFTVDTLDEHSAFHGAAIADQAEYVNDAIKYILSLYTTPGKTNNNKKYPIPTSVIVIGHSMGGVVARAMLTAENHVPASVNTIITLATPHQRPPISIENTISIVYQNMNSFWKAAQTLPHDSPYLSRSDVQTLRNVAVLSIASGNHDYIVHSDSAEIAPIIPEENGFTVYTTAIPYVWTAADHRCILWCNQFVEVLADGLFMIANTTDSAKTVKSLDERLNILRSRFSSKVNEPFRAEAEAVPSISVPETAKLEYVHIGKPLHIPSSELDSQRKPESHHHVFAIPRSELPNSHVFSLYTDHPIDGTDLKVYACQWAAIEKEDAAKVKDVSPADLAHCRSLASRAVPVPVPATKEDHAKKVNYMMEVFMEEMQDIRNWRTEARSEDKKKKRWTKSSSKKKTGDDVSRVYNAIVVETSRKFDDMTRRADAFLMAQLFMKRDVVQRWEVRLFDMMWRGVNMLVTGNSFTHIINIPVLSTGMLKYRLTLEKYCQEEESSHIQFPPLLHHSIAHSAEEKFWPGASTISLNFYDGTNGEVARINNTLPSTADEDDAVADISERGNEQQSPSSSEAFPGLKLRLWRDPTCSTYRVEIVLDMLGTLGLFWRNWMSVWMVFPVAVLLRVWGLQVSKYIMKGYFPSFGKTFRSYTCFPFIFDLLLITLFGFVRFAIRRHHMPPSAFPDSTAEDTTDDNKVYQTGFSLWVDTTLLNDRTLPPWDYMAPSLFLPMFWYLSTGLVGGIACLLDVLVEGMGKVGGVIPRSLVNLMIRTYDAIFAKPHILVILTLPYIAAVFLAIPQHTCVLIAFGILFWANVRGAMALKRATDAKPRNIESLSKAQTAKNYQFTALILYTLLLVLVSPVLIYWGSNVFHVLSDPSRRKARAASHSETSSLALWWLDSVPGFLKGLVPRAVLEQLVLPLDHEVQIAAPVLGFAILIARAGIDLPKYDVK